MNRSFLGRAVSCCALGLLASQAVAAAPAPLDRTILPLQEPARPHAARAPEVGGLRDLAPALVVRVRGVVGAAEQDRGGAHRSGVEHGAEAGVLQDHLDAHLDG